MRRPMTNLHVRVPAELADLLTVELAGADGRVPYGAMSEAMTEALTQWLALRRAKVQVHTPPAVSGSSNGRTSGFEPENVGSTPAPEATSSRVERMAPPDQLWVCGACGKMSEDLYGMKGWHSRGWDESCMLNATLQPKEKR